MLRMELHIEREMAALAEEAQVAELAALRFAAAQVGGRQDDLAPGVWVPAEILDPTPRIRGAALAAILGAGNNRWADLSGPIARIVGTIPRHELSPREGRSSAPGMSMRKNIPCFHPRV